MHQDKSRNLLSLFQSYEEFNLKNRTVMAPMTRYSCDKEGIPSKKLEEYYIRRAQNDISLIITESAAINNSDSLGYIGGLQFHNENHVDAWKPIIKKIQSTGSKVWIQLFHPGRLTVKEITGGKVLAPTNIKPYNSKSYWRQDLNGALVHFQTKTPFKVPEALTQPEIKRICNEFVNSAIKAEKAGFDGIEIHGAHGYLIHQFNSLNTNIRDDEYSVDGNYKFISEIIKECKKSISIPISYRISNHFVDNSFIRYNENKYNIPVLIRKLDKLGIDVFHVSEINVESKMFGSQYSLSELISLHTNKPMIVTGSVKTLKMANQLLDRKGIELIGFGRNLISNPDLLKKIRTGERITDFNYSDHINLLY